MIEMKLAVAAMALRWWIDSWVNTRPYFYEIDFLYYITWGKLMSTPNL